MRVTRNGWRSLGGEYDSLERGMPALQGYVRKGRQKGAKTEKKETRWQISRKLVKGLNVTAQVRYD